MYGVNNDKEMGGNQFEYMIADNYDPNKDVPEGFTTKEISKQNILGLFLLVLVHLLKLCQKLIKRSFQNGYQVVNEIAEGYNVEMYTGVADYVKGIEDEKYYSEIWIPVKKK